MKMPKETFALLKSSALAIMEFQRPGTTPESITDRRDAWALYNEAVAQLSYDDSHPRFKKIPRIVAPSLCGVWEGGK